MSDPQFSSSTEAGSATSPCPRAPKMGAPKSWDTKSVLKILCKKDKAIVDQLAKTKVTVADAVYFEDPYFDGAKWTTKKFDAGGSADPVSKEILILQDISPEDAALTFYHEVTHQNQPPDMGWPEPAEDDAYEKTEAWAIERGLPSQGKGLRKKDKKSGKIVPDKKAIRDMVQKQYPSPPPPVKGVPQPVPIGSDPLTNQTKVQDPVTKKISWRPSQKGDTYAGPQKVDNPKVIAASDWKCP